jgi:hypothetical protein
MTPRKLILALCASFALLATPASAQVAGPEQGVTAGKDRLGGHTIRFAKRAAPIFRRIAGRRITIGCDTVVPNGGGYSVSGGMSTVIRAPRRRGTVRTLAGGRADYCYIRTRGRVRGLVAMVPVTRRGRIYLDELLGVALMQFLPATGDEDDVSPRPADEVVADGRGLVVALDGPDASPPAGKVGYWTDGTRFVVAYVGKVSGRRLFFEDEGDDVVRTNVLPYLTED